MHSGAVPGQPGRGGGHVRLRRGPAGLVPGRVLAVEPARRRSPRTCRPGNFSLNLPIFSMYLNDLPAIESWTSAQMGGKSGACVPETMRFNGNGYYNGGGITSDASCATASSPELQRRDHHVRRGDRAVDLAAVPGHREPELPAAVLPGDGAGGHVPAGLAVRRDPTATCTRWPTRTRRSGRCRTRPPTSPPTRRCSPPRSARRRCWAPTPRWSPSCAPPWAEIEPYPRTDAEHPVPAAEPAAHLRVRGRERRRPGH